MTYNISFLNPGVRLRTIRKLANGEYVHESCEWRLLICSQVWRVIYFNFLQVIQTINVDRKRGGVKFSLQFVYVYLSVGVYVNEQNSSRTDASILTQFSLNGCFLHWLGPYWNWWPWVKGQGHNDLINIHFFLHNDLLTSLLCITVLLCLITTKFGMPLRYTLGWFVFEFYENRISDDVIVMSFKFSPNNLPYFKFYLTYKLHT